VTIEERRVYRAELLKELYNTYFKQTPRGIRIDNFNQLLSSDSEKALAYISYWSPFFINILEEEVSRGRNQARFSC
jgi:hypothetical protein